jgi:hypothetical protein
MVWYGIRGDMLDQVHRIVVKAHCYSGEYWHHNSFAIEQGLPHSLNAVSQIQRKSLTKDCRYILVERMNDIETRTEEGEKA